MTTKLLPCPFCGEQPKVLRSTGEIVCGGQECFGPVTTAANIEDSTVQWNRRSDWQPKNLVMTLSRDEHGNVIGVEGVFMVRTRDIETLPDNLKAAADALLSAPAFAPLSSGQRGE